MNHQSDALKHVRNVEKRYRVAQIVVLVFLTASFFGFVGYQANHAINEIKKDNTETRKLICEVVIKAHLDANGCR